MRDAFGGIFNLAIVSVFLVVVMGILGLTVNYTKAFKAKNIIISTIEEYGGSDGCFKKNGICYKKIKEDLEGISYHPHSLNCPTTVEEGDWISSIDDSSKSWGSAPIDDSSENMFCYRYSRVSNNKKNAYYNYWKFRIITQVDIDIPIINKIMGLYFFQVKGDTRKIEPAIKTK